MSYYTKKIEKIIAKTSNVGWRYAHAKDFRSGCVLFVDFVLNRLHDLSAFSLEIAADSLKDITPEIQDKLQVQIQHFFLEARHTMEHIIQEYATLLDTYKVVVPLNEDALLVLQEVLKDREQDIFKEIKGIHGKVLELERRAAHTKLSEDATYKQGTPILEGLKQFGLKDLVKMFKTVEIPKVFSLLGED